MSRGIFTLSLVFLFLFQYLRYRLPEQRHSPPTRRGVGSLSPSAGTAPKRRSILSQNHQSGSRSGFPAPRRARSRSGLQRLRRRGQAPGRAATPYQTLLSPGKRLLSPSAPSSTAPGSAIVRFRAGLLRFRHRAPQRLVHLPPESPVHSIPLQFTPELFHATRGFLSWRSPLGAPF